METQWLSIALIVILLLLSGFFSSSETSLFALDEMKIKKLPGKESKKIIRTLLKSTSLLLITILFGNTAVNTAVASLMEKQLNIENPLYSTIAVTAILLTFGDIIPKTIAVLRVERMANMNSRLLYPFFLFIRPLTKGIDSIVNGILNFFRKLHRKEIGEMDRNQLSALISIVSREEIFDKEEKELIESVLTFAGREVWNIMTPRTKVMSIEKDTPIKEVVRFFKKTRKSKIAVYEKTDDNITGVIFIRDVFQYVHNPDKSGEKKAADIMRPMYFVPETKKLSEMLEDFRKKKLRIAAVVDEYGSALGIVTIADVLGEIVGELMDESFSIDSKIIKTSSKRYLVGGDLSLADFNDYFETDLESEEYETVAGYVIEKAGDIPEKGYHVELERYLISVKDRSEKHIEWLMVEEK